MTTVISIKSKDGIILASDSQGTSSKVKTTIKKVFKIKANGTEANLPVLVLPGMHDDVIAVAVGYGRDKGVGMALPATETQDQTVKYDDT
jgi:hypothetical protein